MLSPGSPRKTNRRFVPIPLMEPVMDAFTTPCRPFCMAIKAMINTKGPVMFDCRVAKLANCFPMIPSGKAHNEMLLGEDVSEEEVSKAIGKEGKVLV